MPLKLYLAGPEVFLKDARSVLDAKAQLTRAYGFEPVKPGDIFIEPAPTPREFGLRISSVDEHMMNSADGIIANLTPFRGIAADVGTAFELGYMCAQGKIACAYTNVADSHFDRAMRHYEGSVSKDENGRWRGSDGISIEAVEMIDNLMLHGGVVRRSGLVAVHAAAPEALYSDLTAFEQCLKFIAERHGDRL